MWISRARYEALIQAEIRFRAAEADIERLRLQVERERYRAERALEAMLAVRELPSVAPPPPPIPEKAMFEDDPEVVAEWEKHGRHFSFETLIQEGGPRE